VKTDLVSQTFSNLRANKLRSFLTMFGIVWGVISIVVLSAVGEGFLRGNQRVLEELGKNIIIIRNGRTSLQAGGERAGRVVRLDVHDVVALETKSRLLAQISPELMRAGIKAKSAFNASSLQMSGVWPVFQDMRTIEVDRGRLLSRSDNDEARRVIIIGFDASTQLFADRDPVGMTVSLNGLPYTVVGRIRKKAQDSNYTGVDNDRLFTPYETMRKDFPMPGAFDRPDMVSAIIAAPHPFVTGRLEEMLARMGGTAFRDIRGRGPVEIEVRQILSARHEFDPADVEALSLWNTALESIMFSKVMDAMGEFFTAVSVITLVLGGIGVMNIMLIAVRERTREIGIRKAIGATSGSIQWQFFSEGLSLTGLSGVIGFVAAIGLCQLANLAPPTPRFAGMIITWQAGLFSLMTLTVIGVTASLYPARRASRLEPIEALRYET
jgi:putative ABC transport system permease protein